MSIDLDMFYEHFAGHAQRNGGPEAAAEHFVTMGVIDDSTGKVLVERFRAEVNAVMEGGPVIRPLIEDCWYRPARPGGACWTHVKQSLTDGGKEFLIEDLDLATDQIVGLTPNPHGKRRSARGLVVGYIQSGKTTNFTGVIAKLADQQYRLVIVLAGIHNALRRQTQERLNNDLIGDDGRWHRLTGVDEDFDVVSLGGSGPDRHDAITYLTSEGKTTLAVVKKNAFILRKLVKWLDGESVRRALRDAPVLVIDDEADQASVATATINPLLQKLLDLFPRGTYIGYTATPFANVFIDPTDPGDLYPRDFIYSLPRPDGYFGPEELFGRDTFDDADGDLDGYDMIRRVPDEDEFLLRPGSRKDVDGFLPTLTSSFMDAIHWFVLATAARRARGDGGDSSMLVHTSFQTKVHDVYRHVIKVRIAEIAQQFSQDDTNLMRQLRSQWVSETKRVPASDWGREAETFEQVAEWIPEVLKQIRVIADHSYSGERLDYRTDGPNAIIAIGGNTLSRGITLNGLVSSLFIRPSNTYDSLLQMGRWFGFRAGYEDLPRLWTTGTLEESFRHLSLVEHEMRQDMKVYELQGVTPAELAVRVRSHPALRITAKMGAAIPAAISYSGSRLQTRFFRRYDPEWLADNLAAAEALLGDARRRATPEPVMGSSLLFRDVDVNAVLNFLAAYDVLDRQVDFDTEMIIDYIHKQLQLSDPQLTQWNVGIVTGQGGETVISGLKVRQVVRAPLKDSDAVADIKTLMSKEDLVLDIEGMTPKKARTDSETELKRRRLEDGGVRGKGLLVLYPIDPASEPATEKSLKFRVKMEAVAPIVGVGLVFPRTTREGEQADRVQSTYFQVDLAPDPEQIETAADVFGAGK